MPRQDNCTCGAIKDKRAKLCKACNYSDKKGKPWTGGQYRGGSKPGFKQSDEWIQKRIIARYGYDTRDEAVEQEDVTRWHLYTWSKQVKESYNNKCAWCGSSDSLHAHHIIPRYISKEYELCVANGIALCHEHHWELHRQLSEVCHSNL